MRHCSRDRETKHKKWRRPPSRNSVWHTKQICKQIKLETWRITKLPSLWRSRKVSRSRRGTWQRSPVAVSGHHQQRKAPALNTCKVYGRVKVWETSRGDFLALTSYGLAPHKYLIFKSTIWYFSKSKTIFLSIGWWNGSNRNPIPCFSHEVSIRDYFIS